MMTSATKHMWEFEYDAYERRQRYEIQRSALDARSWQLSVGRKFLWMDGLWVPNAYPGISIVSMMEADSKNEAVHAALCDIQYQLERQLDMPSAFYMLPPDSFHQTLANTFSADRYIRHVVQPGLESAFPEIIGRAFEAMTDVCDVAPVRMRLIGLSLFRTAIGMLGVFDSARDFDRILKFRDGIYGFSELQTMGLKRTRPFVGHITLAYIESQLYMDDRIRLVDTVADLNKEIAGRDLTFAMHRAEPRWYDHLAAFEQRPGFPLFSFV